MVHAVSGCPANNIANLFSTAFRKYLCVSSISDYDCALPSSVLPHTSKRNYINVIQFKNKLADDFPVGCYIEGSKIDENVGFEFRVFRDGFQIEHRHFRIRG